MYKDAANPMTPNNVNDAILLPKKLTYAVGLNIKMIYSVKSKVEHRPVCKFYAKNQVPVHSDHSDDPALKNL